jgi:hypothetical protein
MTMTSWWTTAPAFSERRAPVGGGGPQLSARVRQSGQWAKEAMPHVVVVIIRALLAFNPLIICSCLAVSPYALANSWFQPSPWQVRTCSYLRIVILGIDIPTNVETPAILVFAMAQLHYDRLRLYISSAWPLRCVCAPDLSKPCFWAGRCTPYHRLRPQVISADTAHTA